MSADSSEENLLSQLVENREIMLLWGRYGAIVQPRVTKTFLQSDLAAACAQTGRVETPILPKWCRKYSQQLGIKTYVLVLPPRNMVATFQREMGAVANLLVPYTVPYQVHIIQTQDDVFTRNAIFWANTDINATFVLRRCTTPNMYDMDDRRLWAPDQGGRACFGSHFTSSITSVRGAEEICRVVIDASVNGAFNNDLNGGHALTYLPSPIKDISIPETLLGVSKGIWEANAAATCIAKMHLWRKAEEEAGRNPVAEVVKIPWREIGTLEGMLQ